MREDLVHLGVPLSADSVFVFLVADLLIVGFALGLTYLTVPCRRLAFHAGFVVH